MRVPKRLRTPFAAFAGIILATALTAPATAGPAHQGTDPYSTGCASGAYAFASKAVSGGTLRVFVSPSCGTNWIEYSGVAQYTWKRIEGPYGVPPAEIDYTAWAYSMQVYAPGAGDAIRFVYYGADSVATAATCTATCTWY